MEQLAPDQEPLVAVDEAEGAFADPLAPLENAVEAVVVSEGEREVGRVASFCLYMTIDGGKGGVVQARVGVQEEEPGGREEGGAGIHLPGSAGTAPQDEGAPRTRGAHRLVT